MTDATHGLDDVSKAPVTKEVAGTTATASGALSQEAFSDPRTFLKTLSSDLHKIEPSPVISVTKKQLLDFASNPADTPSERAAANIAYNHYDELAGMSHLPLQDDGLYNDSADTILALSKGDSGWSIASTELALGCGLLGGTFLAGGGAAIATLGMEIPPLAAVGGVLAIGGGSMAAISGYNMFTAPGAIKALGKQDRATLSTWKEINGQVS